MRIAHKAIVHPYRYERITLKLGSRPADEAESAMTTSDLIAQNNIFNPSSD